ncbi:BBE domain-containing protein [Streptomyces flavalbus]|uniref:BBE domain-containing protein n=1 Tax=Streptomyces flavalbus TaxID=2665155 RepID=A0ABW2WKA4_9ACTN
MRERRPRRRRHRPATRRDRLPAPLGRRRRAAPLLLAPCTPPRHRRPHQRHGPESTDQQTAYHGANHPRTQHVKAACDPQRLFNLPQAVTCQPAR